MAGDSLLLLSSTHTLLASPDPPLTLAISPDKYPFSLRVSASAPLERLGPPRVYRGSFARTRSGAPRRGREPGRAPVPSVPSRPGPTASGPGRFASPPSRRPGRPSQPPPSAFVYSPQSRRSLPSAESSGHCLNSSYTDSLPTSGNFARRAGSGCALSPPRAPRAAQRLARALRGRSAGLRRAGAGTAEPERGLPPSPPKPAPPTDAPPDRPRLPVSNFMICKQSFKQTPPERFSSALPLAVKAQLRGLVPSN